MLLFLLRDPGMFVFSESYFEINDFVQENHNADCMVIVLDTSETVR